MTKLKPRAAYLLLLAIQMAGALFVVWRELPDFRQLVLNPGFQLPYNAIDAGDAHLLPQAGLLRIEMHLSWRIQTGSTPKAIVTSSSTKIPG
jgi:hypothetical protein